MRRRHFLTLSAQCPMLVYALNGQPLPQPAGPTVDVPLHFFSSEEAKIVDAATALIFPSDDSGPGAREAGVTLYIDRQLAGPYGRDRYRYTRGPFHEGIAEQGYQGQASPRQIYRDNLKALGGFLDLTLEARQQKLASIEGSYFFRLLRQHTLEGMFCDPMHGGNRNLIGWQLIGFPGPYMSWARDIDQHSGEAFRPSPQSLSQILNRPVRPWEEIEP